MTIQWRSFSTISSNLITQHTLLLYPFLIVLCDLPLCSFDDHKMDIIGPIIAVFVIFLLCTCCGLACKRKREGAIFSSEYLWDLD